MTTQLTPHFTLEELVGSSAAPASAAEVAALPFVARVNLTALAQLLEKVRGVVNAPLVVTSGYRGTAENAEVGGVKTSQHMLGAAADILVQGMTSAAAYAHLIQPAIGAGKLGQFGQLIVYPVKLPNGKGWSHIHISTLTGTSNAQQVLVAVPNPAATDTAFVAPQVYFGVPGSLTLFETPAAADPDFSGVSGGGSGGLGPVVSSSPLNPDGLPTTVAVGGAVPLSTTLLTLALILLLAIGLIFYGH